MRPNDTTSPPPGASAGREEEIRARCEAATDGPWEAVCTKPAGVRDDGKWDVQQEGDPLKWICETGYDGVYTSRTDAEFIASAREDVPWLLAQLADARSALAAERAAGAAARDALEWALSECGALVNDDDGQQVCTYCQTRNGHGTDCPYAIALRALHADAAGRTWLIERSQAWGEVRAIWWAGGDGFHARWTEDASRAVRFSSRVAAEAELKRHNGIEGVHHRFGDAVEHVFIDAACALAADRETEETRDA